MMALPDKRTINAYGFNEQPDVDEEYAEEIQEAIGSARVLDFVRSKGQYDGGSPKSEVDLLKFLDPRTGEVRYAVSIFGGGGTGRGIYDFAAHGLALSEMSGWVPRVVGQS
jgi:hypothetical protein